MSIVQALCMRYLCKRFILVRPYLIRLSCEVGATRLVYDTTSVKAVRLALDHAPKD